MAAWSMYATGSMLLTVAIAPFANYLHNLLLVRFVSHHPRKLLPHTRVNRDETKGRGFYAPGRAASPILLQRVQRGLRFAPSLRDCCLSVTMPGGEPVRGRR